MRTTDPLALRPERNQAFEAWAAQHPGEQGRALFGSATLGRVLGLLTLHAGRAVTMATVVRALGGTTRARTGLSIASSTPASLSGGSTVASSSSPCAPDHALLAPLRATCPQTCTVGPRLRWAREELGPAAVEVALVFGSVAGLEERPDGDLDLFIVGSATLAQLHRYLGGLGDEIDRAVYPVCRPAEQVRTRFDERHSSIGHSGHALDSHHRERRGDS